MTATFPPSGRLMRYDRLDLELETRPDADRQVRDRQTSEQQVLLSGADCNAVGAQPHGL